MPGILHARATGWFILVVDTVCDNYRAGATNKHLTVPNCMNLERKLLAEWVQRIDRQWIEENISVFQLVVIMLGDEIGRGAVAVDLTRSSMGGGHPFTYWPQSYIQEHGDPELNHLVGAYLPYEEVVVMLLKPGNQIHTYRISLSETR